MDTDSTCRLLQLPAELRNIIWALSFTHDNQVFDLVTTNGPPAGLLSTCCQIHDEAKEIYKEALVKFWPTAKFNISINATHDQIAAIPNTKLKQVNDLTVYGRGESYLFFEGMWNCTKICASDLKDDIEISRGACPNFAIYEAVFDSRALLPRNVRRYKKCSINCSGDCDYHFFLNSGNVANHDALQDQVGWKGLSTSELDGMLTWYRETVDALPGHQRFGRPLLLL